MPHVGCVFHLYGFHFDAGQTGSWMIESWPPTGDRHVVLEESWTASSKGDWQSTDQHLSNGHYKLFFETFDGHSKKKTFWVEGCGTTGGEHGKLKTITVSPASATIALGTSQTFTAKGFDKLGTEVSITPTWSASGSASCNSSGTCTASVAGTFVITAASGEVEGRATLHVTAGTLMSIQVSPREATIALGSSQPFTARGRDQFDNVVSVSPTWSIDTSNGSCSSSGTCTSTIAGIFTVSATSGNIVGTATLTVTPFPLASITVLPPSATILVGESQTFTAQGLDQNGTTVSVSPTWSVNSNNASCDTTGTCTSNVAGNYVVTAASSGITGIALLNVTSTSGSGGTGTGIGSGVGTTFVGESERPEVASTGGRSGTSGGNNNNNNTLSSQIVCASNVLLEVVFAGATLLSRTPLGAMCGTAQGAGNAAGAGGNAGGTVAGQESGPLGALPAQVTGPLGQAMVNIANLPSTASLPGGEPVGIGVAGLALMAAGLILLRRRATMR